MAGRSPTVVIVQVLTIVVAAAGTVALLNAVGPKLGNQTQASPFSVTTSPASPSTSASAAPAPPPPPSNPAYSLLHETNLSKALKILDGRVPSDGGIVYLRAAPGAVNVEFIDPNQGTQMQIGPRASAGTVLIQIQNATNIPLNGSFRVFDPRAIDPGAPARIVHTLTTGPSAVPPSAVKYVEIAAFGNGQRWIAYLDDGRRFAGDAQGRNVRRL